MFTGRSGLADAEPSVATIIADRQQPAIGKSRSLAALLDIVGTVVKGTDGTQFCEDRGRSISDVSGQVTPSTLAG